MPARNVQIRMAQRVACLADLTLADKTAIMAVKGRTAKIKLTVMTNKFDSAEENNVASRYQTSASVLNAVAQINSA